MERKKYSKINTVVVAVVFFGLTLLCWLKPADAFSVTERRPLEQFPKLSLETLAKGNFMSEFEEYTLDQFPFRDTFRGIKAVTHLKLLGQSDNNGVYAADGYISKMDYPLSEKALENAAKKFGRIYDTYIAGSNAQVYHAIIPDKNYFLAKQHGYLSYDYAELYDYFAENLSEMKSINITEELSLEDFYYTDIHWRQEEILPVAQKLAREMGAERSSEYEKVTLDVPFYGVYYGQLGLPMEPDRLSYLNHEDFADCKITNHETGKEIPMYDTEKAKGRDPYEMYLSGAVSVITIENPNADTEKELVMFRDSFGSSLAPLLVEGYRRITLFDVRYLHESMIGEVVEFSNQDVLFLHSAGVLNHPVSFH